LAVLSKKLTVLAALLLFAGLLQPVFSAAPPRILIYTAKLLNSAGLPVTTSQSIRFSLWNTSDWVPTDIDGLGAINVLSPGYSSWQEVYVVTPNNEGIFTVELGSISGLPTLVESNHKYLEVDVKPAAAPDTSYEILDPTGNIADANDRKPFSAAPYAINAITLDSHNAGNSPNNIPVLDALGKLVYGVLPDGVNADTFTLDYDNNAPANVVTLQFGNLIAQYLRWNNPSNQFEFSSNLAINGDLTFSGTGNITGATIDGTLNTITNIPATAIAPYDKQIRLSPEYDGAALKADGTANNGIMSTEYEDLGGLSKHNYYNWLTNLAAPQDLDIKVRYQLPTDFVAFSAIPLTLTYRTADAVPANNSVDLTMTDSTGAPVALSGASGLAAAAWTDANITFTGAPVFTPGSWIEITVKATAVSAKYVRIADLVLNYNGH
jgi:hypothetical protein